MPVGATTTVTSSAPERPPSIAKRRNTYVPVALNVAVFVKALAGLNVTVPGPLTLVHDAVKRGFNCPSSAAVPVSSRLIVGCTIVRFGPALATGA